MTEPHATSDLDALLAQLDALEQTPQAAAPARLIVATDWSDAAPVLTLLKAFRAIVSPDAQVQLAFAVPHDPTEGDAECVQVLVEGADSNGSLTGLEMLSFDEAASEPYDSAVVPNGDAGELLSAVGGLIVRMHDLMRREERVDRSGVPDSTVNQGDLASLRRRLDGFTG